MASTHFGKFHHLEHLRANAPGAPSGKRRNGGAMLLAAHV